MPKFSAKFESHLIVVDQENLDATVYIEMAINKAIQRFSSGHLLQHTVLILSRDQRKAFEKSTEVQYNSLRPHHDNSLYLGNIVLYGVTISKKEGGRLDIFCRERTMFTYRMLSQGLVDHYESNPGLVLGREITAVVFLKNEETWLKCGTTERKLKGAGLPTITRFDHSDN